MGSKGYQVAEKQIVPPKKCWVCDTVREPIKVIRRGKPKLLLKCLCGFRDKGGQIAIEPLCTT